MMDFWKSYSCLKFSSFLLNFPVKPKAYCPYFENLFSVYFFREVGGINTFENCNYLVSSEKNKNVWP